MVYIRKNSELRCINGRSVKSRHPLAESISRRGVTPYILSDCNITLMDICMSTGCERRPNTPTGRGGADNLWVLSRRIHLGSGW